MYTTEYKGYNKPKFPPKNSSLSSLHILNGFFLYHLRHFGLNNGDCKALFSEKLLWSYLQKHHTQKKFELNLIIDPSHDLFSRADICAH